MRSNTERNYGILMKILPENYQYQIIGVFVRKHSENATEVELEAHFRVNVEHEDGFNEFLADFSKSSLTSYNKMNQRDRSGTKASLYGTRGFMRLDQQIKMETKRERSGNQEKLLNVVPRSTSAYQLPVWMNVSTQRKTLIDERKTTQWK